MNRPAGLAALTLAALALPAAAQPVAGAEVSLGALSDHRQRGLSWSGGKAAASASASVPLGNFLSAGIAATTLRGSRRHGGADAGLDADLRASLDRGGWRLSGGLVWHAFPGGRGTLDYGEAVAGAAVLVGPVEAGLDARYAPRQRAIGGDNLHLAASLTAALPGTPWTVNGGIGRSMGDGTGDPRAARLRPAGDYWDWQVGVDHVRGPLGLGLVYSDTSIGAVPAGAFVDRHTGARIAARVRFFL